MLNAPSPSCPITAVPEVASFLSVTILRPCPSRFHSSKFSSLAALIVSHICEVVLDSLSISTCRQTKTLRTAHAPVRPLHQHFEAGTRCGWPRNRGNLAQGDYDSAEHLYHIQGPCHSLLLASIDSVPRRNGLGLYVLASTFFSRQ